MGAAFAWAEAAATEYKQDPDLMLDKPLAWLRISLRAAAERLGVAKGMSFAEEDRADRITAAGGMDALFKHPGGLDAALAELGL